MIKDVTLAAAAAVMVVVVEIVRCFYK